LILRNEKISLKGDDFDSNCLALKSFRGVFKVFGLNFCSLCLFERVRVSQFSFPNISFNPYKNNLGPSKNRIVLFLFLFCAFVSNIQQVEWWCHEGKTHFIMIFKTFRVSYLLIFSYRNFLKFVFVATILQTEYSSLGDDVRIQRRLITDRTCTESKNHEFQNEIKVIIWTKWLENKFWLHFPNPVV
jgi:hypothetical protein